mgnify:CR=1 FL=1
MPLTDRAHSVCLYDWQGKDNENMDMLKLQIFAKLSEAVSEETGIAVEDIASTDRREEVVDARYVLVYLLHLEGFYASMIAPLIGIKKRSVNRIISDFEHRLCVSPMMRIVFEHLKSSRGGY